jgi:hypothetical protein
MVERRFEASLLKSDVHVFEVLKSDAARQLEFYKWVAVGLGGYAGLIVVAMGISASAVLALSIVGKIAILLGLISLALAIQHAAANAFFNLARMMHYDLGAVAAKHPNASSQRPNLEETTAIVRDMTIRDRAMLSAFLIATACFFLGFTDLLGMFAKQ